MAQRTSATATGNSSWNPLPRSKTCNNAHIWTLVYTIAAQFSGLLRIKIPKIWKCSATAAQVVPEHVIARTKERQEFFPERRSTRVTHSDHQQRFNPSAQSWVGKSTKQPSTRLMPRAAALTGLLQPFSAIMSPVERMGGDAPFSLRPPAATHRQG